MEPRIINMHTDPGHGWAEVERSELVSLGIADKITAYSYQRGSKVYLEEDCDLATFCNALRAQGVEWRFRELHRQNTPIRRYDRYQREH